MDTALKQRMVGASVLVALGVIFIPKLLNGPGDPGHREVVVDLPAEPDRTLVRIPINAPVESPPSRSDSAQVPDEPPSADRDPRSGSTGSADAQAATTATPPAREVATVTPPVRETRPPATQPSSSSPTSSAATSNTRPSSSPPNSSPPSSSPPSSAVSTAQTNGAGWLLQLGSFGNAANASKMVEQVSAAGYNAWQDSVAVGGRTLYRVRVGHWQSKSDAADAGTRLAQRFSDLEPAVRWDDSRGSPDPTESLRGYMVQVGAFGERANAVGLRDRLRGAGYKAHVVSGDSRYRVLVGPELTRSAAEGRRDTLKRRLSINGIVISHP